MLLLLFYYKKKKKLLHKNSVNACCLNALHTFKSIDPQKYGDQNFTGR